MEQIIDKDEFKRMIFSVSDVYAKIDGEVLKISKCIGFLQQQVF